MLVLKQPETVEELEELARSYGADPSRWIKPPQSLLRDVLNKDVVFVERAGRGLTALRYCVYLDVTHFRFAPSFEWLILCEDCQEIRRPDGSIVNVERNLPYLRETWRVTAGETSLEAAIRAAKEEGGLVGLDPSLFVRVSERDKEPDPTPSFYFEGIWTERVSDEWGLAVPDSHFDPEGNVERDEEEGVTTYFRWRPSLLRPQRRITGFSIR